MYLRDLNFEEKKKKIYSVLVSLIILISVTTIFNSFNDTMVNIKNDKFDASFNSDIYLVNRNKNYRDNDEYKTNTYTPLSSDGYFNYLYQTGFENNNHNWTSNNGGINTIPPFTFQGSKSYRTDQGISTLNQNFTISHVNTLDITYYLYGRAQIVDGFLSFGFNVSYNNKNIQLDFVMEENGNSQYSNPPEVGKYKFLLGNYTHNMWIGYMVEDIRNILYDIDSSSEYTDIILHNIHIKNAVNIAANYAIFFDEFSIHSKPYSPNQGMWYDEENNAKTDFQLETYYEVYIDSDVLDIRTINIQFRFFAKLITEEITFEELTIDLVIVPLYRWSEINEGIYDQYTSDVHRSIMYPLPYYNFMGDYLDYEYFVEYGCGGYSYSGEPYFDVSGINNISNLHLEWKKPISL